jgi:tetratricopeptide (TPR) repeat protein
MSLALAPFIRLQRLVPAASLLAWLTLTGCKTAAPPAPVPAGVSEAQQLVIKARRLADQRSWAAAGNTWAQAAERFALLDDNTNQAIALHGEAAAWRAQGQYSNAWTRLQLAEQLGQLPPRGPHDWLIQIDLAQLEANLGKPSAALDRLEHLRPLQKSLPTESLRGLFFHELAVSEMRQGLTVQADADLTQAELSYRRAKDAPGQASTLANRAQLLMQTGHDRDAIPVWQAARAQFEQLGNVSAIAWCWLREGQALLNAGTSPQDAEPFLRRAAEHYRLMRDRNGQIASLESLADCLHRSGRAETEQTIRRELDALKSLP